MKKRLIFILLSIVGIFFLDRLLKYLALSQHWQDCFFYLKKNYSVFWEIGQGKLLFDLVSWVSVLLLSCLFLYLLLEWRGLEIWQKIGLSLVLIGGISNTIDRFYYGFVIDYFKIWVSKFNLADVYILGGLGLFLLARNFDLLRKKRAEKK